MSLEHLRQEIDLVDKDLVTLLEKRMALVSQVADYKERHQLPVLDQGREVELLTKIRECVVDKSYEASIVGIFADIMKYSKSYQKEQVEKKSSCPSNSSRTS